MTEEYAYIVLRRQPQWLYRIRRFDIVIDGERVGSVANGQEEMITAAPGKHMVELRVSWVIKSQMQTLELKQGDKILLECETPLSLLHFVPIWLSLCVLSMKEQVIRTYFWLFIPLLLLTAGYGVWLFTGRGKFIFLNEPKPYEKLIASAN